VVKYFTIIQIGLRLQSLTETSPNLPSMQQLLQGANINKIPDIRVFTWSMAGTDTSSPNRRNGRASYIGYHTNKEINTNFPRKKGLWLMKKNAFINYLAGRSNIINSPLDNEIGEIISTNEGGNQYVYGLPVYTASEKSLEYGFKQMPMAIII